MYCVELTGLKWYYETAEEVWYTNVPLQVRKSCPPIQNAPNGVIFGVRIFYDFKHLIDQCVVLQYHSLKVYKVDL